MQITSVLGGTVLKFCISLPHVNTYPLTVKREVATVGIVVVKIVRVVDIRAQFLPCHHKNPSGIEVAEFSTFIVVLNVPRG